MNSRCNLRSRYSKNNGSEDGKVKLDGDNVVEFQKLLEFQQVALKMLCWNERERLKEAQMVD